MDVALDAPLAPLTTLGLGGPARRLVTAYDERELLEAVRAAEGPLLVLGGGSNVVLPDEGWDGTVVRVATTGIHFTPSSSGATVTAAAGESWDGLVARSLDEGLVGLEALSGIPGLVGASPIQNVGAYGQEVAQTCTSVRFYDHEADAVQTVPAGACDFSYRSSLFKAEPGRRLILAVTYELARGAQGAPVAYDELARELGVSGQQRPIATEVRAAVLTLRRRKGMVIDPADPDSRSAGSFFTNPVLDDDQLAAFRTRLSPGVVAPIHPDGRGGSKVSAAWLVEQAGFTRGWPAGPVGISAKHSLALVHRGGGRAADLLALAATIQAGVREAFGISLEPEPVVVSPSTPAAP
ncbi:MAG TPA: UDP-N-acetylmuramate dehydrogenase [Mycobacteriales bacterium]|nr:UDP-N-acetylmuramate dehydrogenase [Mycobacteriales bacterium]